MHYDSEMATKIRDREHGKDLIYAISLTGIILIIIPIILILYFGFFYFRDYGVINDTLMRSIELTLFSSGLSAVIIFFLFTPLAYELARKRHRVMDMISDIPSSIPHPIVGIAILILGSPLTPFGHLLNALGISFFNTVTGMTVALIFISAPIYIRASQTLFRSLPTDPERYAEGLGLSRTATFYRIIIPQNIGGLISGALTAMSRSLSEFGSIAIVSFYIVGGIFAGTSPASVLIWKLYGFSGPSAAITASAVMIVVSMIVLLLAKVVSQKGQQSI